MPIYEVTGPDGRQFEVEGPHPPSEAELQALFDSLPPVEKTAAPSAPQPSENPSETPLGPLGAAGIGVATGGAVAPAIVGKVGEKLMGVNKLAKFAGGATGLLAGGSVGSALMGGHGSAIGGMAGYAGGRKLATMALPSIHKVGETMKMAADNVADPYAPAFPTMGAKSKNIVGLAKLLKGGKKIGGPLGLAMIAADLFTQGKEGILQNLANRTKSLSAMTPKASFEANMGITSEEPDDELLQEMLKRNVNPVASH